MPSAVWLTGALVAIGVASLLGNFALAGLGHDTVLRHTGLFLDARQGVDSWGPMVQAYDYVATAPSQPLYEWLFFEHQIKFIYPPTSLLFIEALDLTLPRSLWQRALNATSWLLVVVTAWLCAAILDRALPRNGEAPALRVVRLAVAAGLALTFYPIVKAYSLGQAQVLANAALAGLVYAWQRGHPRTAGVLVAVMAALKPQYALIGAWGVLRRQWSFAASSALAGTALLALSLALFGASHHVDYLAVLGHIAQVGEAFYPNQTVNGLLNRLFETADALRWDPRIYPTPHPVVRWGTFTTSVALLLAAFFAPSRVAERAGVVDLCVVALAVTMASPIAWEHHYAVLLPIFAVLLPRAMAPVRPGLLVGLAIAYAIAANHIEAVTRAAGGVAALLQSGLLFAATGILVVLLVERARAADPASTPASSGRPDGEETGEQAGEEAREEAADETG